MYGVTGSRRVAIPLRVVLVALLLAGFGLTLGWHCADGMLGSPLLGAAGATHGGHRDGAAVGAEGLSRLGPAAPGTGDGHAPLAGVHTGVAADHGSGPVGVAAQARSVFVAAAVPPLLPSGGLLGVCLSMLAAVVGLAVWLALLPPRTASSGLPAWLAALIRPLPPPASRGLLTRLCVSRT